MGPTTSISHASNGHEATVGWSSSEDWCMNPHGFDRPYTFLHIQPRLRS